MGWIGVDLDGTLANNSGPFDKLKIGPPIPKMVERIKAWLAEGKDVRIFTARLSMGDTEAIKTLIKTYCEEHLGKALPITDAKDHHMEELWDDKAIQVIANTGERADGKP